MAADGGIRAASPTETPRWAVRLRGARGDIVGAGILLSPELVLTCAHVVDQAAERITAEFVGAACRVVPSSPALLEPGAYVPVEYDSDGDPSGDVALLRLERPRPSEETVRLHRLSTAGREVQMYGFPRHYPGGVWFRGRVVGGCGRDGQVQLAPVTPGELAAPGCSGAGAADSETAHKVFGMVTNRRSDRRGGFSYMIPAETVVGHLPQVRAFVEGLPAVDDRLRSSHDDTSRDLLDTPFAERLAAWFRDDGRQVKISVVGPGAGARAATLRRAITLADRELPTSVRRACDDPPATVPSAGGLDLAVHADGLTCADIAERITERMGLWSHGPGSASDRLRAARSTLTLVVVGVDEAVDPPALLDLLDELRARGSRLLLVFRSAGALYAEAAERLVTGPARERRARLEARLTRITGPLAEELSAHLAAVRPEGLRHLDTDLVTAHTLLRGLALTAAAPHRGPDLSRYERQADRIDDRLRRHIDDLRRLRERRDELSGRLQGYRDLHQHSVRGEEDPTVDALYLRAHTLLRARPCDVRAAEAAVAAYTAVVDRRDDGGTAS